MRIYEHGLLWTELKVTCQKCGCDFIFQPKDLKENIEYDFSTLTGSAYKYTLCPECGNKYIYTDPISQRYFYDNLTGTTEPTESTIEDSQTVPNEEPDES